MNQLRRNPVRLHAKGGRDPGAHSPQRRNFPINHPSKRWPALILIAGLALLLAACSGPAERLWPDAPGWSRAVLLGSTRSGDPVQPALDAAGRPHYLLVPQTEEGTFLRLVNLGPQGEIELDRQYEFPLTQPHQPSVIWDGEALRLLWISDHQLFSMAVEPGSAEPLAEPRLLSGSAWVDSYAAAVVGEGSLRLWFAGSIRQPGLYALELPAGEPRLVDPQGVRPQLAWEADSGTLHAVWARLPAGFDAKTFFYARYPQGHYTPNLANKVAEFTISTSTFLVGPSMVVEREGIHLFWSELIRTGMQAGSAEAYHLSVSEPEQALAQAPEQLFMPLDYHLPYQAPPASHYAAGPRVPLDANGLAQTGFITEFSPVDYSPTAEIAVAITSRMNYLRRKTARQVGVMYLGPNSGGYQLLSFTPGDSETPGLSADRDGYLYATWLERSSLPGFTVYATTTQPDIVAALDAYTREDYSRIAGDAAFGLLSGVLLAPLAGVLWALAPMVVLFVLSPLRKEGEALWRWPTLLSLVLAVASFWLVKQSTLAGLGSYVPFSAWLPRLGATMDSLLQIAVPILIGLLGCLGAWAYTYRREKNSVLHFMMVYAVIDGGLTAAIYGVLVYGAA